MQSVLILTVFLFFLSGCSTEKVEGVLVHSLQASHQATLFHEGKKILLTEETLATSVVNNPVKLGGVLFVRFALDDNVTVAADAIGVVSKNDHIRIIPTPTRINPTTYRSDNIDHALQSVGCVPSKTQPNTAYDALPPLAKRLMNDSAVIALKINDFEGESAPFFIAFEVGEKRYKVRYLLKKIEIEE